MVDILNFIMKISGLLSCFAVPLLLSICWHKNMYNSKRNTLSDCGGFPFTAKLFTFTLAIFAILEINFTYAITKTLLPAHDAWIFLPAFAGGLFTVIVAVFDCKRFPVLHNIFSYVVFILLILWCGV